MVLCDIGRASLLVLLPFVDNLGGSLLDLARARDPDAAVGSGAGGVGAEHRAPRSSSSSANSLSLAASYGTFPIASIIFSLLAGVADRLGGFGIISRSRSTRKRSRSSFDAMTFLVSAVIVYRLPIPRRETRADDKRIDWTETFREIKEGLQFVGAARAGARRDARPRRSASSARAR